MTQHCGIIEDINFDEIQDEKLKNNAVMPKHCVRVCRRKIYASTFQTGYGMQAFNPRSWRTHKLDIQMILVLLVFSFAMNIRVADFIFILAHKGSRCGI